MRQIKDYKPIFDVKKLPSLGRLAPDDLNRRPAGAKEFEPGASDMFCDGPA